MPPHEVWDPHLQKDIDSLERTERSAAHFMRGHRKPSNHDTYEPVVTPWDDLEGRRRVARLCMMYKANNGLAALPSYFLST